MARHIVLLDIDGEEHFMLWSTVVNGPLSPLMTLGQFCNWCEARSRESLPLEPRLERARAHGTSCQQATTALEMIEHNRAGRDEACLSLEQLIEEYRVQTPPLAIRDGRVSAPTWFLGSES